MNGVEASHSVKVNTILETLDEYQLHQKEMSLFERQTRQSKEKIARNQRVPKHIDGIFLNKLIQLICLDLEEDANCAMSKIHLLKGGCGKSLARNNSKMGGA